MSALQITAIVLCFTIPLLGWALLFRQSVRFYRLFQTGAPDPNRNDQPATRVWTVLREFLGHTRLGRLPLVSIAHWFTALGFFLLFATLVNAFFQPIWAAFRLPVVGHFTPFEWLVELFAGIGFIGICVLIWIRQRNHPRSADGAAGRSPAGIFRMAGRERQGDDLLDLGGVIDRGDEFERAPRLGERHRQRAARDERGVIGADLATEARMHGLEAVERREARGSQRRRPAAPHGQARRSHAVADPPRDEAR